MRLIHSAAGLCMMLLAFSVHTETMAASQKVNVGAADAQERAGVGQRGGAIDSNIGRSDIHSKHMELEDARGCEGFADSDEGMGGTGGKARADTPSKRRELVGGGSRIYEDEHDFSDFAGDGSCTWRSD